MSRRLHPDLRYRRVSEKAADVIFAGVRVGTVHQSPGSPQIKKGWVARTGGGELREVQVRWPPYPLKVTQVGSGQVFATKGEAADALRRYANGERYGR